MATSSWWISRMWGVRNLELGVVYGPQSGRYESPLGRNLIKAAVNHLIQQMPWQNPASKFFIYPILNSGAITFS